MSKKIKNIGGDWYIDWRRSKKVPTSKEVHNTGMPFISWGGKKNNYNLFLNTLYKKSSSQSGIINGKVYYMTAGGYTITPAVETPESKSQVEAIEKNSGMMPFSKVFNACKKDYELYNGFCFVGLWSLEKVAWIKPLDFGSIRTDKARKRFFYSEDWTNNMQSFEKTGFREYTPFDPNNRVGMFIVWVTNHGKNTEEGCTNVYPDPPYSGCIESLMTEIEIQNYHFYETQNSFKSGTMVYLPSAKAKSQDDRDKLAEKVKTGATDRETSGGIFVLFGEGGTEKPEVLPLNGNDLDKRYLQTETSVAENIMRGHSIGTPGLFGMRTGGKLGDVQELETGFKIFTNVYVTSRLELPDETFTKVVKEGFMCDAEVKSNLPGIMGQPVDDESRREKAISMLSPLVATKVLNAMTTNEVRSLGKFPPVEGGDTIPSQNTFSATDPILKKFKSKKNRVGLRKSRFIVKDSKPVPHEADAAWFDSNENEMLEALKGEKLYFATLLTDRQKNVLSLINDGHDVRSIAQALKITVQEVQNSYNQLSGKGLIKKNGELSEAGKKYLIVNEAPIDQFEIRYSYELRPEAPKLKTKKQGGTGESRPFCRELMRLDKFYTREEIDTIGAAVGRNVWDYRGGWYHNPNSDTNTPYCRHHWVQHIVFKP